MTNYAVLLISPFFDIKNGLCKENKGDNRVSMLTEVNMSSAERLRIELHGSTGVKPSYTALIIKAILLALLEHPYGNRILVGPFFARRIVQLRNVDVSVMVERDIPGSEQANVTDMIRDTHRKDVVTITQELRTLAIATAESSPRWRQYKWIVEKLPYPLAITVIRLPLLSPALWVRHRGGAVMISSPAKYGVDLMVAAWPWPLGFSFGLVKERPFANGGHLEVVPTTTLTMSFDRRIMAGAPGARLFHTVCTFLQDAEIHLLPGTDEARREGASSGHRGSSRTAIRTPRSLSQVLGEGE